MDPTERSMPPEMMTTAWPAARIATIETCLDRLVMLPTVMKNGERNERTTASKMATRRIQTSGWDLIPGTCISQPPAADVPRSTARPEMIIDTISSWENSFVGAVTTFFPPCRIVIRSVKLKTS